MDKNLKQLKHIVISTMNDYGSPVYKIYLFGSKATGDADKQTDYDLLLITKNYQDRNLSLQVMKKIRERLAQFYIENHIPAIGTDIIIHSKQEIEKYKNLMGTVTYQALKEGVLL